MNFMRLYARLSAAVLAKVILVALAFWFGSQLDKAYGTEPYIMFGMVILAMAIGIWWIVRIAETDGKARRE